MTADRAAFAVLGATGFTGRAIVGYLLKRISAPLKWIIAGRDVQALTEMAAEFAQGYAPEIVEIEDLGLADIGRLTSQTEWLINAAGPYAHHGDRVIESCLGSGTHYIDISGEVDVIGDWIHLFHDRAVAANVQIIPAAGFEALPFDLMTRAAVERMAADHPVTQVHVDVLLSYRGLSWVNFSQFASSGTVATALETLVRNPSKQRLIDPSSLIANDLAQFSRDRNRLDLSAKYDHEYQVWRAPLIPGPFINPAVIHRSNALLNDLGEGYGQGFSYEESMNVSSIAPWPLGQSVLANTLASSAREFLAALGEDSVRRQSTLALWRSLAEQPSRVTSKSLDAVGYQLDVVASHHGTPKVRARMYGTGHPGYRSTGNIIGEIALGFAKSRGKVRRGGVLTPAVGLEKDILARLNKAGISCCWL